MNLHLPSHLKDHPYTCARVEDQGRVGPQQSWLDRVRPKEHKEWKAKVVFLSGMIQITRAKYTGLEEQEQQKKNKNRRNKALIKSMRSQNVFFFLGFLSSAKHK